MFGKSNAGHRSVPRSWTRRSARLAVGDRVSPVTLIDLSRTGARLSGLELAERQEKVVFRCHDVKVHAQVVWREGETCAIEFETPIAPAEVRRLNALPFHLSL